LVGGMLIDRFNAARVASALLILPISALLLLWLAPPGALLLSLVAAALLGMATGGEATFLTYLVGRYFGQQYFARIYALLVVAMSLGGGLGPLTSAWLHERSGNYSWMLIGCLVALVCAMVPPLRLGPYRH
jgi:MFS family permease